MTAGRRGADTLRKAGCLGLFLLGMGVACTPVRPARMALPSLERSPTVTHADFDEVLRRFVDEQGLVDYSGLRREPGRLERYYLWLSRETPGTTPGRFDGADEALAYWLNAYNASGMVIVLRHYPIEKIADVPSPLLLDRVFDSPGFHVFQRLELGGEAMGLRTLQTQILEQHPDDPRLLFALHGATRSSPPLGREAFVGHRLDDQLDERTRAYFEREESLRIDDEGGRILLPDLLRRHEATLVEWLARHHPDRPADLLAYAALHVSPERRQAAEQARARGYRIGFVPEDPRLNDSRPGVGPDE